MSDPSASVAPLGPIRHVLAELVPVMRRAATLDPDAVARLRVDTGVAAVFVRLPFRVLASRRVSSAADSGVAVSGAADSVIDTTVHCGEFLAWYDGVHREEPVARDAQWRSALPPMKGWQRIETVPDEVVRDLVRKGALALKEATGATADTLLDSVVLTVTANDGASAEVSLRALSALTRMGFLPRDSHIAISIAGRWTRVAAEYGSVYLERPGLGLNLF